MLSRSGAFHSVHLLSLSGAQGADEVLPIRCPTVRIICHSSVLVSLSTTCACFPSGIIHKALRVAVIHGFQVQLFLTECVRVPDYRPPVCTLSGKAGHLKSGVASFSLGVETCLPALPAPRSEDQNMDRMGFPVIPSSPVSHLSTLVPGSWLSPGVQGQSSSYVAEHGVPVRFLQARGVVQVTLAPRANRSGKSVRSRLQPFCRASSCFLRCPVITLILPDLTLDTDLLALWGRGSCSIFRSDLAQCA